MVDWAQVFQGLGNAVGGGTQVYARASMDALEKQREQVLMQLQEQRRTAERAEDRAYESAESEKEREFKRELIGEEREWEKEKLGMQEASEEKRLRLAASLRPKGGGGSGKPSADERKFNQYVDMLTAEAGLKEPTPEIRARAFKELNKLGEFKSTGGSDSEPAALELSRRLLRGELGREPTDAEVAADYRKRTGRTNTDTGIASFSDYNQAYKAAMERLDPDGMRAMTGDTELAKEAEAEAKSILGRFGKKMPEGRPADEFNPSEEVRRNEQPGVVDAPATSTKGDKTAGMPEPPRGDGSERSPYIALNEEQVRWAVKNAPKDSWVIFNGQRFQVE